MSDKARCVFDTNAVVSAALYEHGVPGTAFYWVLDNGEVLVSEEIVQEINEVLARQKFRRYISKEATELFLRRLVIESRLIEVMEDITECRDPEDDKFLELAVSGNASHIITGDEDLLVLSPFRGIPILTPREFVDSVVADAGNRGR